MAVKRLYISLLLALGAALLAGAATPSWEVAKSPDQIELADRAESEQIEIRVKDRYVYVTTNEELTVKVYSILGQLISTQTIQPGTYRLQLPSRGIYILKAGTVTRRITI